jgi:hypothetical protein
MIKTNTKILLNKSSSIILAILFSLQGCGGGGGGGNLSSSSVALCADGTTTQSAGKQGACSHHGGLASKTNSTPTSTNNNPTVLPAAPTSNILYRGFSKPTIQGLAYISANPIIASGVTDSLGKFPVATGGNYSISFKVGGILLYRMSELDASTFSLADLYQLRFFLNSGIYNSVDAENLAAFLMVIDDDANPANGIQISALTKLAAASMSVNFNQSSDNFYADPNVQFAASVLSGTTMGGARSLPPTVDARALIN